MTAAVPTRAADTLHLVLPLLAADVRDVLAHRFGLFGRPRRTQLETARLTHKTQAEVYRLEHAGLDHLRRLLGANRNAR